MKTTKIKLAKKYGDAIFKTNIMNLGTVAISFGSIAPNTQKHLYDYNKYKPLFNKMF